MADKTLTRVDFVGGPWDGDVAEIPLERDEIIAYGDPETHGFPATLFGMPVRPLVGIYRRQQLGKGAGFSFVWQGDEGLDDYWGIGK
jgi:hypothetical protein